MAAADKSQAASPRRGGIKGGADPLTLRAYQDGDRQWVSWQDAIFNEDSSHKCPVYVHRTPPCQASCPSGEDVRGWLQIVRG
ncbi:MAG: hypothetical protein OXU96_00500, partial [Gammaproteobacteria bacterium]|nr:hypothetical protein [Gammaproteobacteria bacterium]